MEQTQSLLTRLQNHICQMAPHQQERYGGKLLIEAAKEIQALHKENAELKMALRNTTTIFSDSEAPS